MSPKAKHTEMPAISQSEFPKRNLDERSAFLISYMSRQTTPQK
jgi:hypothetical protein